MRVLIIISLLLLASCSAVSTLDPKTLYQYTITEEATDTSQLKRLAIATVNYGTANTPVHLRDYEIKVDLAVANYLRKAGYEIISGNQFESVWARAVDQFGEYYDPYSATFRRERFNAILVKTLQEMKESYNVDGIIFTDLIQQKVNFDHRDPHYASWHGVRRKPRMKGGSGVPLDYNWAKSFRAASLSMVIFRSDKKFIFSSVGGIEVIDNMSLKTAEPKAMLNKYRFSDKDYLQEGIQLALHPFIKMENYPK